MGIHNEAWTFQVGFQSHGSLLCPQAHSLRERADPQAHSLRERAGSVIKYRGKQPTAEFLAMHLCDRGLALSPEKMTLFSVGRMVSSLVLSLLIVSRRHSRLRPLVHIQHFWEDCGVGKR